VALKKRLEELATIMLENGAILNNIDSEGNNALHIAIKLGLNDLAIRMAGAPLINLNSKVKDKGGISSRLMTRLTCSFYFV
jgi:ankyrin repeat protein